MTWRWGRIILNRMLKVLTESRKEPVNWAALQQSFCSSADTIKGVKRQTRDQEDTHSAST
jgi:hypothetical protein